MPAPIPPWMSASAALTIWMLSTAMKAPSVAPNTASQVFADTAEAVLSRAWMVCGRPPPLLPGATSMLVGSAVMGCLLLAGGGRMHWATGFDNQGNIGRIIQQGLMMPCRNAHLA